ncbi:MAG: CsgG/HfaB family protein [Verrucomicrobiae bacterium]|nr:CsgG/HfaB family protein [Verrucomicrobiae bacterium]
MKQGFAVTVLCFALAGAGVAQDKPTVFVAPLDGDLAAIQGWQPAMGEGLAEMLITELTKLGKFEVLESTALPELIGEIELGQQGYVAKDERVEKGQFAGADFMFRGKVTRFGAGKQGIDLGGFVPGSGGKLGLGQTRADVRIDWRFVDTATRKIIKTGQAVGQHTGLAFDVGVGVKGHGGKIGFHNQEFMNSALGKATVKALESIVQEIAAIQLPESGRRRAQAAKAAEQRKVTGQVLAVAGKNTLIVSLGSDHGVKSGDKLKLYELVELKDDEGNVVFTEEKLVGEITLESVQADRSKAHYAGDAAVKKGWVVKFE